MTASIFSVRASNLNQTFDHNRFCNVFKLLSLGCRLVQCDTLLSRTRSTFKTISIFDRSFALQGDAEKVAK